MIHGEHGPAYVIFSLIVAVLGSWTALDLQQQARSHTSRSRHYWLAMTSVAMGTSIFSMHFIAMLGFNLGIPIRYDIELTIISLLLAIAGTGAAFLIIQGRRPSAVRISLAGLAMGSAICLMHYVGMAAMRITAVVSYNGWMVLGSWLIAVVVAAAALLATLRKRSLLLRIGGATVLGFAIFSMHFTAMAAASFKYIPAPHEVSGQIDQFSLALWVGTSTLLLLFLALISGMFDRQLQVDRAERLQRRLHQASQLNAMSMMASTLAHELNQPLAAAANYLVGTRRLLSKQPSQGDNPQLDFGLNEAEQQIRRAAEIIKRVRAMVSGAAPRREATSLPLLVEHSIGHCRSSEKCIGLPVRVELDPNCDQLLVDPVQTEQVLVNLIRNAIEAMAGIADPELTILSREAEDCFVEIQVRDRGIGLPLDTADDLFAALPESTGSGLGLGLAISRTIVEAHEGRMWATTNRGRGATFHFTMPLAPQAD